MNCEIIIIGCGIIGAAIAYELSQIPGLKITVLDQHPPAEAATGAALGVLMGMISQKVKGKAWQMRLASMQRYETLIPELEAITGRKIPVNRHGILKLCLMEEALEKWKNLAAIRHKQGFSLEIWELDKLQENCPEINCEEIQAAIYSPQDRQVDPVILTLSLVEAATQNGVDFQFGVTVTEYLLEAEKLTLKIQSLESTSAVSQVQSADWLIVAAGLGSENILTKMGEGKTAAVSSNANIEPPCKIRPVLGQAIQVTLRHPLGKPQFQPVITGDDVHIVPIGELNYWVGATVEFSHDDNEVIADPELMDRVLAKAITFCPDLAAATVVKKWSGLRPRPEGHSAPIITALPGYNHVLLATGHYRNGILLAPATAQIIRQMMGV